jgi:long-chain fatty acid transport protein
MGGVGIASPQDSISAIFANPAAMCFGAYCPGAEATFSGTYFNPTVKGTVDTRGMGGGVFTEESQMEYFLVPAIGITSPITDRLRIGFGAYGFTGMGVDYKEQSPPVFGDLYTKLEVMKFAPNIAYLITPDLSVGASVHIDYGNLDLGSGGSHGYAMGLQLGALYHIGIFNFGLSYITPQKVSHDRVADFDGDGKLDTLELEGPQSFAFGVSAAPLKNLLIELNLKWYNWGDAEGYKDFDWENQWVYAIGGQYKIGNLSLRAGFNYGKNPVKEHNGFNPQGTTNVQGKNVPNVNYEFLRIIGFPAIVEKHLTLGLGYELPLNMSINISYVHVFEETMEETSAGGAMKLSSSLEEDSITLGLTWRF